MRMLGRFGALHDYGRIVTSTSHGGRRNGMDGPVCEICNDKGFVRDAQDNVNPCPACNEDSGMIGVIACGAKDKRRARNGGYSAACVKPKGHEGTHADDCGCWWR